MHRGIVMKVDRRGFGFIAPEAGESRELLGNDIFFHVSQCPNGEAPDAGTHVLFTAVCGSKGLQAASLEIQEKS